MALHINLGAQKRRWRLDLDSPPVVARQTGSRLFALFMIGFALVWGGFPVLGLIEILLSGEAGSETVLFLIFPVVGVGILLYGVHSLLWRRTIGFDGATFSVSERGLRGLREWREPLSSYIGVLRHTRRVKTKNSSYTLYMVDLVHEDEGRRINLYTDTSEQGFRQTWERYARQLGLPALEQGAGGMVRREAADLDKSVGELVREGKVDIDYEALSRPARGVAVSFEGDTVIMTRTGPQNPWWGSLLSVLFPLVFVGVGLFAADLHPVGRIAFTGIGLVFELLFGIAVYRDLTGRQRLRVGPDGVRINRVGARGEDDGKRMPLAEIEAVTMGRKDNDWRQAVVIAGDRQTLRFGGGLSHGDLEFVMNTVLAKVAETERRRRR